MAKIELNTSSFFGKQLVIDYAKTLSDETRRQQQDQQADFDPNFNHSQNVSLQKVIAERRKKRKQNYGEKRLHKREQLMNQEQDLMKQKEEQEASMKKKEREQILEQEKQKAIALKQQQEAERLQQEKAAKAKVLPSRFIQIENLQANFSKLMLEELIKSYPGVEGIVEADGPAARAVIEFSSADSAKFAVMGLNRFKVDSSGRELKVAFTQEPK